MNLDIWLSWYKRILNEFGFNREDDEKSAEILNSLLEKQGCIKPNHIQMNQKVIVFGAGPSLKRNIKEIKELKLKNFTLIAADGATTALLEEDIIPDIIVTDLDGLMDDIIKSNDEGAILVIHAHGNNAENIEKYVPSLQNIIGTTQSIPLSNVYNFGGFTDGDRCLFFAAASGAKLIILAGMDFGDIVTSYSRPEISGLFEKADKIKRLKLKYAKELTEWIAENENIKILNISGGEKLKNVEEVEPILLEYI
ncbi:6-hydroxymethylpterin diphosphokinase MptE-like protein [Methanobacterium sp. ACI-7]|uniref:6-hydroxymethylpterin diphosphokinase MptE-like protein n=1 Tax=unclassified Methanobacterium TaxID=2627676 RepID=UPI0039C45625